MMRWAAYWSGYISAWFWDFDGMPLNMSVGDVLAIGVPIICCIAALNLLI